MVRGQQLNVAIEPELLRRLKHKVLTDEVTIKQALVQMIEQYVDGAIEVFSDLGGPAKRKRRSRGKGRR